MTVDDVSWGIAFKLEDAPLQATCVELDLTQHPDLFRGLRGYVGLQKPLAVVDDQVVEVGTTVRLRGKAIAVKDIAWKWTQVGGPTVSLNDEGSASPYFDPSRPGQYVFQLVVTEGGLPSAPATSIVSVCSKRCLGGGIETSQSAAGTAAC